MSYRERKRGHGGAHRAEELADVNANQEQLQDQTLLFAFPSTSLEDYQLEHGVLSYPLLEYAVGSLL
jgi:hypothetical protein